MPSNDSSPDEKCTCGCTREARMGKPRGCLVHGFHEFAPKGSGSSSPDDECRQCRHARRHHDGEFCSHCAAFTTDNHHAFVPAGPESRYCGEGGVCRDPLKRCGLKCRRESPQCRAQFHGGSVGYRCQLHEGHSEPHTNKIPDEGTFDWDDSVAVYPTEPEAPELRLADLGKLGPRPPYAVAYVTGSGARIELALPGEASCAVIDGALVICHSSQVLGIAEVKPWEGP